MLSRCICSSSTVQIEEKKNRIEKLSYLSHLTLCYVSIIMLTQTKAYIHTLDKIHIDKPTQHETFCWMGYKYL